MSDMVAIWHPDHPGVTSRVSRAAYERRSAMLGWVLAEDEPVTAEPVDPPNDEPDEKTLLTRKLEAAGVKVDGRRGVKWLRTEAAKVDARDEDLD